MKIMVGVISERGATVNDEYQELYSSLPKLTQERDAAGFMLDAERKELLTELILKRMNMPTGKPKNYFKTNTCVTMSDWEFDRYRSSVEVLDPQAVKTVKRGYRLDEDDNQQHVDTYIEVTETYGGIEVQAHIVFATQYDRQV